MKRLIILLTLIIFSLQFIQAGSVGITPAHYKEFFEPGLTKTFNFYAFSSTEEEGVDLYIKGDLSEYVNISRTHINSSGDFTVTISLPNEIKKPGTHKILVGAMEAKGINQSGIGGVAAIQGRIDIMVPYPGKYAESTFKISNINEGENAPYQLEIKNLGTQSIIVNSKINIYKVNSSEVIITETIPEKTMEPKETLNIQGTLDTKNLPPGEYVTFATIEWGRKTVLNQTFRVGEFLVEIVDYDYQFEQGKINPFVIKIENKWNTKIDEVFATVSITDEGVLMGDFRTVTVDTRPWEIKNITGYFDTSKLEAKRYTALIELSYDGETTSKLVAIYVNEPPTKTYITYIIIAAIVIFLIIAAFAYLIWKIRKLSRKNGKKK